MSTIEQSFFYDPEHRLKIYNALKYELDAVQEANLKLARHIVDRMLPLTSEELDMQDLDDVHELLGAFDFDHWSLPRYEDVGRYDRQ